ncbi:hypothetical protein HELRODRAFT_141021, partial [Helobdella robusta]|uniref:Cadherin domain-containing protein n=1 Tax=Helobdella robusta TaxID=6412 RepID=T1EJ23_HELRO
YKFTLVASDNGKSSRQTTLDLIIKIVDVNDNSPQFESSHYSVSLPENSKVGTEIIRVLATDADEGMNGIVKYGWSDDTFKKFGSYFSIDSGSGSIRLKKTLDYEKSHLLGPIHLSVMASDQGVSKKSSYTTVTVRIVDVNDNEPFIYFKPIPKNSPPGTEVARFSVVDRDEGRNGQIACDIRDVSLPASAIIFTVQIDKQSYINNFVIQTSGEIDRESNPKGFDGFIVCKDHGEPDLNNARRFNLNILDVNDNAPIFELNTFQVHIEENLAVGSPIIRTKAKDNDSGENGEITYTIHPLKEKWNNVLSIDEEGTVRTVSNIDYEKMTKMFFDITAQDHGSPSQVGRASLELNIIDVDEYLPVF